MNTNHRFPGLDLDLEEITEHYLTTHEFVEILQSVYPEVRRMPRLGDPTGSATGPIIEREWETRVESILSLLYQGRFEAARARLLVAIDAAVDGLSEEFERAQYESSERSSANTFDF